MDSTNKIYRSLSVRLFRRKSSKRIPGYAKWNKIQFADSAYEKSSTLPSGSGLGERRGSMPIASNLGSADSVRDQIDSGITPSRFANFFSRKVKSNLKRTKSVNKLDRRKLSVAGGGGNNGNNGENEGSPKFSLKRTMSLGRLSKKSGQKKGHGGSTRDIRNNRRNQLEQCQFDEIGTVINTRIRASRSHESLLTSPSSLHSIDLSGPDVEIKPLHSSMLGQDHCFQVTTATGSKYYSCRSAEERHKWIQHLRKTVEPNQEQSRRTDYSIKLWIQEAKNVASKKRYFCELCLDRTTYARTSSKMKTDLLFWGEHFDFTNLPPVETITVNIYREPDKKRKKEKNTLLGYVNIPVTEVTSRQLIEKWYTCSSATVGKGGKEARNDLPTMRIKVRYQAVDILPMDMYEDLLNYIETDYSALVEVLEPLISVKSKEEIASCLVSILQKRGKVRDLLSDIVMTEVNKLENENLAFRGNSIATKAVEAHMKLVGEKYLQDTLIDFIKTVLESGDDCEVDPMKVVNNSTLARHRDLLTMYCEMAWFKIINSHCFFPRELKEVFHSLKERCQESKRGDVSENLISACIFLRFLCPAILSPSLFKLTQEYPHESGARNLTLIAKTIQSLANFTIFGAKEDYMTFLNEFVERELPAMRNFVEQISEVSENDQVCEFDGYIDVGKETALLHTLLEESLQKMNEASEVKLGKLKDILSAITEEIKNPKPVSPTQSSSSGVPAFNNLSVNKLNGTGLDTSGISLSDNSGNSQSASVFVANIAKESGEDTVAKANELSAFIPVSRYAGSAFDNPHRNGSLPKGATMEYSMNVNEDMTVYKSTLNTSLSPSGLSATSPEDKLGPSQSTPARRPSEKEINNSWTKIVSAADMISGDYVDLISFVDESGETHNSSVEFDTGDQASVGQVSTIGSSGYQSFTGGHSQSNSPVESVVQNCSQDSGNNSSIHNKSISHTSTVHTVIHNQQPLSFANPLFGQLPSRFVQGSATRDPRRQGIHKSPSSSSISSSEDNNSQLSLKSFSSSSQKRQQSNAKNNSNNSQEEVVYVNGAVISKMTTTNCENNKAGMAAVEGKFRTARPPQDLTITPRHYDNNGLVIQQQDSINQYNQLSVISQPRTCSPVTDHTDPLLDSPILTSELSKSAEFSHLKRQQALYESSPYQMRRTATDTGISQSMMTSSPSVTTGTTHGLMTSQSANNMLLSPSSSESSGSYMLSSPRKAGTPQGSVRMGISSVQRQIHAQDLKKSEYEQELTVLRKQLEDTQVMLQETQTRLLEEEMQRQKVVNQWQSKLSESEERLLKQQEEKDKKMEEICSRLINVEEELRREQTDLQSVVKEKQNVIELQEQRIEGLDAANNRLLCALGSLRDRYNYQGGSTGVNGVMATQKVILKDGEGLRSSSC